MNNTILAPNRRMKCKPRQEAGFTLLEILVAVVILSLGLLGLAGLQVSSLNNNQTAYYRSIASQQAYDMADRMRANLTGITAGNYDDLTINTPQNCIDNACTPAEMATSDFGQWLTSNETLLPEGGGTVRCVESCDGSTPGINRSFEITVSWTEKGATSVAQSFVTRFAP